MVSNKLSNFDLINIIKKINLIITLVVYIVKTRKTKFTTRYQIINFFFNFLFSTFIKSSKTIILGFFLSSSSYSSSSCISSMLWNPITENPNNNHRKRKVSLKIGVCVCVCVCVCVFVKVSPK
jgi:hypothetical protein